MENEVNQAIDRLQGKASTTADRKIALRRLSEILEEDYILNLPPQRPILKALERVSRKPDIEASLKVRVKGLIEQYGL